MAIFIAAFFKDATLPFCLNAGEVALEERGFQILDIASDSNIHVLGRRANPEVTVTVVCTRLGQNPTSVVVHAISPDGNAARVASEQVRDRIMSLSP